MPKPPQLALLNSEKQQLRCSHIGEQHKSLISATSTLDLKLNDMHLNILVLDEDGGMKISTFKSMVLSQKRSRMLPSGEGRDIAPDRRV